MAARDVALFGVILFAFAVGFFVINSVMTTTVDKITASPVVNGSNASIRGFQGVDTVTSRMDYIIFGLFIGLSLALIITGWFIGGNPIFMFMYFIVAVISVVLSTVLSNVWETISTASVFGNTVSSFTLTNHLMLRLPIYVSVIAFIGIVVMFAKPYVIQQE